MESEMLEKTLKEACNNLLECDYNESGIPIYWETDNGVIKDKKTNFYKGNVVTINGNKVELKAKK